MSEHDDRKVDANTLVDYAKTLDCVHCGLCLNTCPTYRLTGVESSSPRGRIQLMRAVAENQLAPEPGFVEEMDFCLLCRNCESVCPSGVRFGALMEHTRSELTRTGKARAHWATRFAFDSVLPRRWAISLAARGARTLLVLGTWRIFFTHLGRLGRMLADMPDVPPARERRLMPALTRARGERRGAVAMLEGCVMPVMYGRVNRATADVLARCGLDVHVPRGHACCGSLHAHNGDLDGARELARTTIEAFERTADAHAPIVVNSAGCGSHMKEYAQLFDDADPWKARARAFAARVKDFSEVLATEPARTGLASALRSDAPGAALGVTTYDDPCHLCHGQGIRKEPRRVLDAVGGLARVELADAELCCGSAGIYSVLRPADAEAIFAPKLAALEASGADTLVVANPGCQLQWETGLNRARSQVRVLHIAEVLERATRPDAESKTRTS